MKFEQLDKNDREILQKVSNTNLDFIFLGDTVRVKQDDGRGRVGVVFKIGRGIASKWSISYLIYYMQTKDNQLFDDYLKNLERVSQTPKNAELERDFSEMRYADKRY
jgi:phenylalanyl-tRNA synthetase beta subunit